MKILGDSLVDVLHKAAEIRQERHQIIAGNIANADTPGYVPVDLDFSRELARRIGVQTLVRTDERHLPVEAPDGPPEVFADPVTMPGLDGNYVSLERQMAKLGSNHLAYEATVAALKKKLAILRYAVTEGGA
ncbi:MAG: flagellar basal body rod protein FlgB [Deltaproteobacteria bacterium]|nr:MAG: flagellar basal body rod protein FlgB [Deltaproteobacteria bacterium]